MEVTEGNSMKARISVERASPIQGNIELDESKRAKFSNLLNEMLIEIVEIISKIVPEKIFKINILPYEPAKRFKITGMDGIDLENNTYSVSIFKAGSSLEGTKVFDTLSGKNMIVFFNPKKLDTKLFYKRALEDRILPSNSLMSANVLKRTDIALARAGAIVSHVMRYAELLSADHSGQVRNLNPHLMDLKLQCIPSEIPETDDIQTY